MLRGLILLPLGILALTFGLLLFFDVLSLRNLAAHVGLVPIGQLVEDAHDVTGHDGAQAIEAAIGILGVALVAAAVRSMYPRVSRATTDKRSVKG